MKKSIVFALSLLMSLGFSACSNDGYEKKADNSKTENGIIEKKQHEIATEAVKEMKAPVDKARDVSDLENERNKDIKKASEN